MQNYQLVKSNSQLVILSIIIEINQKIFPKSIDKIG